jgi:hypothetical protein
MSGLCQATMQMDGLSAMSFKNAKQAVIDFRGNEVIIY